MTAAAGANWIELQGTVNARDLGGLPAGDGARVRPGALLRSASLQHLTEADVAYLVGDLGVRRVVDLRTDVEVARQQPGPLHAEAGVVVHHLSLYPDSLPPAGEPAGGAAVPDPVLPWHDQQFATGHSPVVGGYLRYLSQRPDSVVAALRAIAEPDGATLVHCAAGKDRTGVVVALALTVAGVPREVIAADYALTQSQITAILEHLSRSDLYDRTVNDPAGVPAASATVMTAVLDAIDDDFGGVLGWLAGQGWTEQDTARLRRKLLG